MINYPCPICASEKNKIEFAEYHGYQLTTCNECGCCYCQPFKAPNSDFYSSATDNNSEKRHTILYPWPKNHPTYSSSKFTNGEGMTLLDIGCGNGAFAEFANHRNFDVIGIDIDTASLDLAKKRSVQNTIFLNATIFEYLKENPEKKFDIITAFEVIEHLDNPKETIETIKKLLKPDGIFIGTLPNENRLLAKEFNLNFALPPYHLTYWTTETWSNVLNKYFGFKAVVCENNAYYGYLSDISQVTIETKFGIQKGVLHFLLKAIFTLTKAIERPLEKLIGKSSSFYFEFKKLK